MQLFTSGFAFRLNELGIDGYAVDVDAVMKEFDKYMARENRSIPYEHSLPEYAIACDRYRKDFARAEHMDRGGFKTVAGPRTLIPTGGMLEYVFDRIYCNSASDKPLDVSAMLFNYWIDAHANAIINRIYGLNMPTIKEYLMVHDGEINRAIKWLYGGKYDPDADTHFKTAIVAKSRELERELTENEIEDLRLRFYVTSNAELSKRKNQFVTEILNEWDDFVENKIDEVLK